MTAATPALRTLLFSTLYPSAARPNHGIFVETRLRELLKTGAVQTRVVAPVPWFPSRNPRFGVRAAMAATPAREQRHGIDVLHPRYVVIPKFGMQVAPRLLALGARPAVQALLDEGFDFDLIDAHYFYPDGVAAALLAKHFGKPLAITARGSDVNLIGDFPGPAQRMRWAAGEASAVIGVSAALQQRMAALGMPADKLHVLRNGVDLQRFRLLPPGQARQAVGLDGAPQLLSVGNLIPLKGHALCIDALVELLPQWPGARLAIVGQGPDAAALRQHAQARGVGAHVRVVGAVPHEELLHWYGAADILMLASSREGWPNVLLEAMACGTPVVATAVGGIPEVVLQPVAGRLVAERSGSALALAVADLQRAAVSRSEVRRYAENFGWGETSRGQVELFSELLRIPALAGEQAHA